MKKNVENIKDKKTTAFIKTVVKKLKTFDYKTLLVELFILAIICTIVLITPPVLLGEVIVIIKMTLQLALLFFGV